ncbi:MAG: MopE-related protein [Deltaproteobacteria bacterium]|nr:MopE-related protein [Deltaproteobacteria bacterium]
MIPSRLGFGRLAVGCALVVLGLSTSGRAQARGAGFVAEECGGCHRGSTVPKVTITPSSLTPALGSTVRLTITIDVGSQRGAGFYIGSTAGKLTPVAGEKTKVGGEGITHNGTNTASGGKVVIHADWTVPATPGGVDFRAAAIAANMDGGSGGDGAGSSFYPFAYGCSGGGTYYRDFDGDGVGYAEDAYTRSCGKPEGYGEKFGDCDDNDAKILPGATEVCNRRDDNCDGKTDEGLESVVMYPDMDGDGWGRRTATGEMKIGCGSERGWGHDGTDCDDKDAKIFPGAAEICNLKDDNCDGRVDEGARADCGVGWCRRLAVACDGTSCTPGKPQKERCNLLDDDCDGDVDEDPDTLCLDGLTCRSGRCVDSDTAPPVETGGAGGGTSAGGSTGTGGSEQPLGDDVKSSGGCSLMPRPGATTLFPVAALVVALGVRLAKRRRR